MTSRSIDMKDSVEWKVRRRCARSAKREGPMVRTTQKGGARSTTGPLGPVVRSGSAASESRSDELLCTRQRHREGPARDVIERGGLKDHDVTSSHDVSPSEGMTRGRCARSAKREGPPGVMEFLLTFTESEGNGQGGCWRGARGRELSAFDIALCGMWGYG